MLKLRIKFMDKFYNKLVKKSLSNNNTKDFKLF